MLERKITKLIRDRLGSFPAVALLGPRQVGKTTLAKTLADKYYDLELEEDKVRLDLQWPWSFWTRRRTFPISFPELEIRSMRDEAGTVDFLFWVPCHRN